MRAGSLADCKKLVKSFEIVISDPNTADYDKRTPLHLASAEGHLHVVSWLLSKKADPNPIDRFKRTPLEEAVRGKYTEIVSLLIKHKAKVVGQDGNLIDLAFSHLSGTVHVDISSGFTPDWAIDGNTISIMKRISEGSHGSTYKGKWRGTVVAVKVLKNCEKLNLSDLTIELDTMFKVHHPNCIQLLGAVINTDPYMIVYEFMTGGSVLDTIRTGGNFSQWRSLMLAIDLAKGIDHLHDRPIPIIHGDLRPSNLLLGGARVFNHYHKALTTDEMGVLKIADFGLAKTLHKHNLIFDLNDRSLNFGDGSFKPAQGSSRDMFAHASFRGGPSVGSMIGGQGGAGSGRGIPPLGSIYESADPSSSFHPLKDSASNGEDGPLRYQAPELYRRESLTPAVDVYSFGMIVYHLFEARAPFSDLSPEEAAKAASEGQRPSWGKDNRIKALDPIISLVTDCCDQEPSFRPDFQTIVRDLQEVARKMKPSVTEKPRDLDDEVEFCSCIGSRF